MMSNRFLRKLNELSQTVEYLVQKNDNFSEIHLDSMERSGERCKWETTGTLEDEELRTANFQENDSEDLKECLFRGVPDGWSPPSVDCEFYQESLINLTTNLYQPDSSEEEGVKYDCEYYQESLADLTMTLRQRGSNRNEENKVKHKEKEKSARKQRSLTERKSKVCEGNSHPKTSNSSASSAEYVHRVQCNIAPGHTELPNVPRNKIVFDEEILSSTRQNANDSCGDVTRQNAFDSSKVKHKNSMNLRSKKEGKNLVKIHTSKTVNRQQNSGLKSTKKLKDCTLDNYQQLYSVNESRNVSKNNATGTQSKKRNQGSEGAQKKSRMYNPCDSGEESDVAEPKNCSNTDRYDAPRSAHKAFNPVLLSSSEYEEHSSDDELEDDEGQSEYTRTQNSLEPIFHGIGAHPPDENFEDSDDDHHDFDRTGNSSVLESHEYKTHSSDNTSEDSDNEESDIFINRAPSRTSKSRQIRSTCDSSRAEHRNSMNLQSTKEGKSLVKIHTSKTDNRQQNHGSKSTEKLKGCTLDNHQQLYSVNKTRNVSKSNVTGSQRNQGSEGAQKKGRRYNPFDSGEESDVTEPENCSDTDRYDAPRSARKALNSVLLLSSEYEDHSSDDELECSGGQSECNQTRNSREPILHEIKNHPPDETFEESDGDQIDFHRTGNSPVLISSEAPSSDLTSEDSDNENSDVFISRSQLIKKGRTPSDLRSLESSCEFITSVKKRATGSKYTAKHSTESPPRYVLRKTSAKSHNSVNGSLSKPPKNRQTSGDDSPTFMRRITRSCSKVGYKHQELVFSGRVRPKTVHTKETASRKAQDHELPLVTNGVKKSLSFQKPPSNTGTNGNEYRVKNDLALQCKVVIDACDQILLSPSTSLCVPMGKMRLNSTRKKPSKTLSKSPKCAEVPAKTPKHRSPKHKLRHQGSAGAQKKSRRYDPCDSGGESDVMELQDKMLHEMKDRKNSNQENINPVKVDSDEDGWDELL